MSPAATSIGWASSADAQPAPPMIESNDIADDPVAMRERLRVEGYLFFRGLIDSDKVRAVRSDVIGALHGHGWFKSLDEAHPVDAFDDLAPTIGDDVYWPGLTEILRVPSVHAMTRDPSLMDLLNRLYGEPAFRQPRFVPRAVFPWPANPWSEMAAHQDMPYVQGSLDTLTAWMPMGPCLNRGGALEALRGSHVSGLREISGGGGRYRCAATQVDPDDENWRSADFEPGDVLIFSCLTIHRARRNETDIVRLTMDVRYQPTNSDMCEQLLETPFSPHVPEWPDLVGADELARIEKSKPAKILPFTQPGDFHSPSAGRVFPWLRG